MIHEGNPMSFKILETMTPERVPEHATQYMVETRDGVQLATDVYLPQNATQHTAILVRTPYDKTSRYTALPWEAEYYRSRGFVMVTQDVRGKFQSTGDTVPYEYDMDDAYDTVDWIVSQPWSNGKVGVTGASYYGFLTWAAVACGHPAVKAAVPVVACVDMADIHVGSRWHQRVPAVAGMNDLLQIWTNNNGYLAEIDWNSDTPPNIVAQARAQIGECRGAEDMLRRSRTEEWYTPYGERHPYHTTNIPILHWNNWYDPGLCPPAMDDWRHFRSLNGTRELHYLRVNSADHSGFLLEDVGKGEVASPYTSDEVMNRRIEVECGEVADFFEEHCNGIRPAVPRPRARWHLGHVGWQESEEYPPPSRPRVFHLTPGSGLVNELRDVPESAASKLEWTHDPENPVTSLLDMEALWYVLAAYPDERELAGRADVLTFRTSALDRPLDFAGKPFLTVELELGSSTSHLFARLQDVYPDGATRPISLGRAVVRSDFCDNLRLDLNDIAYRLQLGHSLQLQISSSDFPHWGVHPGTDENPWFASEKVKTTQWLTVGGVKGAKLELPTIEPVDI